VDKFVLLATTFKKMLKPHSVILGPASESSEEGFHGQGIAASNAFFVYIEIRFLTRP
jgi:hypothetical protein